MTEYTKEQTERLEEACNTFFERYPREYSRHWYSLDIEFQGMPIYQKLEEVLRANVRTELNNTRGNRVAKYKLQALSDAERALDAWVSMRNRALGIRTT